MSRKQLFLRTRGRLLPTLFLTYFLLLLLVILVAVGLLVNHGFPAVSKGTVLLLFGVCPSVLTLGMIWNWKYSLDILFKSTEIFSGHVTLGQQIFRSKIEACEGEQWELLEINKGKTVGTFKIYSDRIGLLYSGSQLPADLCAGPVRFRYLKRSKYIVEILRTEKSQ